MKNLEKLNMISFCISPLYYAAEGKNKGITTMQFENSYILQVKGYANIFFPQTNDKKLLYKDILQILKMEIVLSNFPSFFIEFFKKTLKVSVKQKEYIFYNDIVINLQGKRLSGVRNNINKLKKGKYGKYELVKLNNENKDEFIEINNIWYKNETEKGEKFRLSGKRAIEDILINHKDYEQYETRIFGVKIDGKLVGFGIGCKASNNYWCTYTIRVGCKKYSDLGFLLRQELGKEYNVKFCLSGTAGTKSIKKVKELYSPFILKKIYSVKF